MIDGITLREDQIDTVERILKARRGCFLGVMSYGKSIVAASILKAYEDQNALILCNRKSILTQLKGDLIKYGFDAGMIDKNTLDKFKVSLCTMATLNNIDLSELVDYWKVIICDEAHIGMGFGGMGEKIMSSLAAPIRIGLTATLPRTDEAKMALEGLIGPVIKKVDFEEGNKLGILTKAKLKLLPIKKCRKLEGLTKYQDIYQTGICDYRLRNQLIIEEVKKLNDAGKSCLIFVVDLIHGDNLFDMAKAYGIQATYIEGITKDEEREIVKKQLQDKEIKCLISTSIFREGVSIHSLDSLVIAFGGKSSVALSQALGRVLRQWEGKENAIIIDCLDSGRYLSDHCIERITLYHELGLIGE